MIKCTSSSSGLLDYKNNQACLQQLISVWKDIHYKEQILLDLMHIISYNRDYTTY